MPRLYPLDPTKPQRLFNHSPAFLPFFYSPISFSTLPGAGLQSRGRALDVSGDFPSAPFG